MTHRPQHDKTNKKMCNRRRHRSACPSAQSHSDHSPGGGCTPILGQYGYVPPESPPFPHFWPGPLLKTPLFQPGPLQNLIIVPGGVCVGGCTPILGQYGYVPLERPHFWPGPLLKTPLFRPGPLQKTPLLK